MQRQKGAVHANWEMLVVVLIAISAVLPAALRQWRTDRSGVGRTLWLAALYLAWTLRVARTLADLDGQDKVARIHVAEALSYRGETLRRAQATA